MPPVILKLSIPNGLILRLGIGAIIGGGLGWLLGFFLEKANVLSEELKNLVVLAGVWGLFGLSQFSLSESGLMATVVAGIVLRAFSLPEERLIRRFKGQLTILCVSVLFILLAADLSIASIFALGWGSVFTVLVLMLLVRPLSVALCTIGSNLNWRQKLFIAWVSPRGIVAASVASLFAIILTREGINGGDSIKALVFLTIIMTVFIQGLTARWVARWLKITSSEATGAVIIGCNPLGRLLGHLIQEQGESVVMIDTDSNACQQAESEDLPVFQSSALNPTVLEEAGIESVGTFIALTHNGEVNLVLAQRAIKEFQPPRVLAAFPHEAQNLATGKINQALIENLSLKTWNQCINESQFKLGKTILQGEELSLKQAHLQALIRSSELLPLLLKRDNCLHVVTTSDQWQPKDELIYLLYDPRPQLLKRLSGGVQSLRWALEQLSEVEDIPLAPPARRPDLKVV